MDGLGLLKELKSELGVYMNNGTVTWGELYDLFSEMITKEENILMRKALQVKNVELDEEGITDREQIIKLLQDKLKESTEVDVESLDDIDWGRFDGKQELLQELLIEIGSKSTGI